MRNNNANKLNKKKNVEDNNDDIFIFDSKFKNIFENDLQRIPYLKQEIIKLDKLYNISLTDGQKENILNDKNKLIEELNVLENNQMYTMYIFETTPILEEYKKILDMKCTDTFIGKSNMSVFNKSKSKLFKEYIKICRKYDKNYILPTKKLTYNICDNCKSKKFEMEDERIGHCLDCGAIREYLVNSNVHKDQTKNNTSFDKNHMIDVVQKFQGKQNTFIKDDVYENIENVLNRYRLLNNSDKKFIKFERVSLQDIKMALEECGYINHYDDCQLIYTNLTGKSAPDLSSIIQDIYDDYDKILTVYEECVEKVLKKYNNTYVRKSFMSGHYILYQILKRRNFKCDLNNFNILKSDGPLFFHDRVYKKIAKRFGWSMIYLS